jgi:hypothetical protein
MDKVKVKKDELRKLVQKNRDAHKAVYEQAFEGYRKACIQNLEANLESVRRGKKERIWLTETPPDDHTSDYDRVLRMIDMSVDTEVVLTEKAFQQYVLDDWDWKQTWAMSNSKYTS